MKSCRHFFLIILIISFLLVLEVHGQAGVYGSARYNPFGIDPAQWSAPQQGFHMALGDMDNDGDLDLLVIQKDFDCYSYETGAFFYHRNIGSPINPLFELDTVDHVTDFNSWLKSIFETDFVDLDYDGDLDLLLSGDGNTCGGYIGSYIYPDQTVFINNADQGPGSFQAAYSIASANLPGLFSDEAILNDGVFVDLNHNGQLDYIGELQYSDASGFSFLSRAVTLQDMEYLATDSLAWDYLEQDSTWCLLTAYLGEDSTVQYHYLCGPVGDLSDVIEPSNGLNFMYESFDSDRDSFPDIYEFRRTLDSISIYEYANRSSTGGQIQLDTARYYAELPAAFGSFYLEPILADIDADGDPDLFAIDEEGTVHFYENLLKNYNVLNGRLFLDENEDGISQDTEPGVPGATLHLNDGQYLTASGPDGRYRFNLPAGEYTATSVTPPLWQAEPVSVQINFQGNLDSTAVADFIWSPLLPVLDMQMDAVSSGRTRPGSSVSYNLKIENTGTITSDVTVRAEFDGLLNIGYTDPAPDMVDSNRLVWNYSQLAAFESRTILVNTVVSASAVIGDTLHHVFQAEAPGVPSPWNDTILLDQAITGGVDPNDKLVEPQGQTEFGNVPPTTDRFVYTIRFQNTGTDTAFIVYILDEIDEDLDLTTFKMHMASHPYELFIDTTRTARWDFPGIELPDSNVDQLGSNGFIQYEIRPVADLPIGTEFTNTADIFFDFNDPVTTNTTVNTFAIILQDEIRETLEFNLFPNPASSRAVIQFPNPHQSRAVLELYAADGRLMLIEETYDGRIELRKSSLAAGHYTFYLRCNEKSASGKLIFGN